ncbi:uncharacterized protein CLUP02_11456 [Colletotrichum lupini]|uniref:Uncharacterized protein n=1 Tax=Colletotrichum lupini TaxID=145971 RepID=A0A9Q8WKB1_9PEZI|nr:uncharacterized protein CLUP02_11456 [Colletotrichum lupini]UQC85957.1 hypothetical protein CLUP02_11456 [Colletotrichum lupini]
MLSHCSTDSCSILLGSFAYYEDDDLSQSSPPNKAVLSCLRNYHEPRKTDILLYKPEVGHSLDSCEFEQLWHLITIVSLIQVRLKLSYHWSSHLINTPGFDNTYRTDNIVLRSLGAWLSLTYKNSICLHDLYIYIASPPNEVEWSDTMILTNLLEISSSFFFLPRDCEQRLEPPPQMGVAIQGGMVDQHKVLERILAGQELSIDFKSIISPRSMSSGLSVYPKAKPSSKLSLSKPHRFWDSRSSSTP